MSFVFSLIILEHQFLKNYISVIYWFISCLKSIEIFIARQNLLRKITKTEYSCAGVSISFRTSGYLRVTGGYICRRPENFEVLDSRRCIFRSFFVALLFHFFAPKSTNLNKFEENYVTIK